MRFTIQEVKRPSPWQVTARVAGSRVYRKFFSSKEKAQAFVREEKKRIDEEVSAGRARPSWGKGTCGLRVAVDEFLDDCEKRGVRPDTLQVYTRRLKAFCDFRGDVNVHEIERDDVLKFATRPECKSPWTQQGYRSDVAAFLTWCSERDWCENKFLRIRLPKVLRDEQPICILTPDEAALMLDNISPFHTGRLAVQLFAGIRPREACRIGSDDISIQLRRLVISGRVAKTRKSRVLNELPENLCEWVSRFPFEPCGYNAWRLSRRRAVGPIGHDALRHSFCSYGYWHLGQETCLRYTGHVDHTTFHRHYVENSVSPEDAKRWFEIQP